MGCLGLGMERSTTGEGSMTRTGAVGADTCVASQWNHHSKVSVLQGKRGGFSLRLRLQRHGGLGETVGFPKQSRAQHARHGSAQPWKAREKGRERDTHT